MAATPGTAVGVGPSAGKPRRPWVMAIRIVVSVALLALLISRMHLGSALPRKHHFAALLWFAAGSLAATLGIVLSSWRWQRVLVVFDAPVRLRTLASHYFAGQFVGNVLPSTIGGDVLRVSRSAKTIDSSSDAFASVVLERLTGFVVLPAITFLGFALQPSLASLDHSWIAIVIAVGALTALAVILAAAGSARIAGRFASHANWTRFIGAVHVGVDRIRRHRRHVWSVLGTAVLFQASVLLMVWCALRTVDVSISVPALLAFIPAVAMAQVAPISVGGFGIREGMLALLLGPLGVTTSQAVAVGVLWYAMTLVASVFGAPTFAVGQRSATPTR